MVYSRPDPVGSVSVDLVVATPARMRTWLEEIETGEREPAAYFGYSEAHYLTFSQWLQDVLRFIKAQNAVIEAYETEAEQHNSAIEKMPPDTG